MAANGNVSVLVARRFQLYRSRIVTASSWSLGACPRGRTRFRYGCRLPASLVRRRHRITVIHAPCRPPFRRDCLSHHPGREHGPVRRRVEQSQLSAEDRFCGAPAARITV